MRYLSHLASVAIGFGLGYIGLSSLDTGVAAVIAWFLLMVGALTKLIALSKLDQIAKKA